MTTRNQALVVTSTSIRYLWKVLLYLICMRNGTTVRSSVPNLSLVGSVFNGSRPDCGLVTSTRAWNSFPPSVKPGFHSNAIAFALRALRKRKPQEMQALASQSWLPLLRPSIHIGWRLRLLRALAFLAVSVYATHATQAIAFGWKPGFRNAPSLMSFRRSLKSVLIRSFFSDYGSPATVGVFCFVIYSTVPL